MQSGAVERKIDITKRRMLRESPKWKWHHQELCAPSHPFSSATPLTYIVQFEWLASFLWPKLIILYFLLRYSRKTFHDGDHFGLDKIKKQLI